LEIIKVEGAQDFDKDVSVEVPKTLQPKSRNKSLSLAMKSHPSMKWDFPLMLAVSKGGFAVDLKPPKLPPQVAGWCKNPPPDIELAKRKLKEQRDAAHGKIEGAKQPQEKNQFTMQSNLLDLQLGLLEFFDAVQGKKVKLHFRIYYDLGEEQKIEFATTEGS
jgi:hypothetical protein